MSEPGLKIRCLASTSVAERDELKEKDERRDLDEEQDEREDLIHGEDASGGEEEDERGSGRSSPATSDSTSQSDINSNSVSESDSYLSSKKTSPRSQYTSCIQEAQLSPDGTCVLTSDHNRTFSVYPVDANILSETETRALRPYAQFTSSNPIWAFAANPLFNLQDSNSTQVLVSRRDSYITLHNALWDITRSHDAESSHPANAPVDISTPVTSYKLIDHLTEAVNAPLSLAYSHDGAHFFAGKQNGIAIFDLESTDDPIHTIPTIPAKRNKLKGGGRGFKGWISALALSPPTSLAHGGVLAAGSRTRYVGIYDSISGTEVTHFSLPGTIDGKKVRNENLAHVMGDGVSYLKWSPCARYLYVAERASDTLLIYDARNFSLSLGYCAGRQAHTKQKMGFDIWNAGASPYDIEAISHEIWAGGDDGMVRVWKDPYRREGAIEADEVVQVGDGDIPVSSILVHPSGSLAVAACGEVVVGGRDESNGKGRVRGGGLGPVYRERGRLDILGLS